MTRRHPLTMPASPANEHVCPSAQCAEDALLLGIVGPDGVVASVNPPLPVDATFIREVSKGRPPETRFRFAGRCVESGCRNWIQGRCNVIDVALKASGQADDSGSGTLRPCAVRPSCRWFAQEGGRACAVCPRIVTNVPFSRVEDPKHT